MRLSIWALSAVSLLTGAASAKAISLSSILSRRSVDYEEVMRRAVSDYEDRLERRDPATTDALSLTSSDSSMNATVSTACTSAVSNMTTISNAAGFAGCYNILEWDSKTSMFQADLRIYQQDPAIGDFANISANQITVMLTFPETTQFKSMVKRSTVLLYKRDGSTTQIQQYSLVGNLKQQLNLSKLNQTMLASLMIPQIALQAKQPTSQKLMTTNMTASDSAWFVAGQFTNISAEAAKAANPATALAAVSAAQGFVLPGTTLGIFPTGLIVTSVWTFLFILAFGLGTAGRFKARSIYRKRIMGLTARGRR